MKYTPRILTCILTCISCVMLCTSAAAQGRDHLADMQFGMHFEIAYGVLWPADGELPRSKPLTIHLTSRLTGKVQIVSNLANAAMNQQVTVTPNVTQTIAVDPLYLPSITGGVRALGISITSTVPITVTTAQDYVNNGSATLHYPIEAWGSSYHAFCYPQDEYGSSRIERRPGQIVVIAAFDSTVVTIQPRAAIAANAAIGSRIAANSTRTVMLQAHQTLTLLGEIDVSGSHKSTTDLTGSHITSEKPVAVMSGHTKGAIGFDDPTFYAPATNQTMDASALRNNYYQSLLRDDYADDTMFVTIPMMYTSARPILDGDVVRVLAVNDNTNVLRSRADGSGDSLVATLQAGECYTDTAVREPYRWKTTSPSILAQYGKSFAQPGNYPFPEMILGGQPTMMIVPGDSRWIQSASFNALEGRDNFLSVVMRDADTARVLLDGQRIGSELLHRLRGTSLYTARLPIGAGTHSITSPLNSRPFMAWVYGGTDGLNSKSAYGVPVGLGLDYLEHPCYHSFSGNVDRKGFAMHVALWVQEDEDCASMLRYEVLSSSNVVIDSISFEVRPFGSDTIDFFLHSIDTTLIGTLSVLLTTTAGREYRVSEVIPSSFAPLIHNFITREYAMAKPGGISNFVFNADSTIKSIFKRCEITLDYLDSTFKPLPPFLTDTVIGVMRRTTFALPLSAPDAGERLGVVQLQSLFFRQPPYIPEISEVLWYDSVGVMPYQNVVTHTRVLGPCTGPVRVDVGSVSGGKNVNATIEWDCAKMLYYVAYDNQNVRVNLVEQTDSYINVQLSLVDTTVPGSIFMRFVSNSSDWRDTIITIQPSVISGVQHEVTTAELSTVALTLSPQPAHDVITIAYRKGPKGATLRLFDYAGNAVWDLSDKLAGEKGSIPLHTSGLARGMYVMLLSTDVEVVGTRVILE